MVVVAQKAAGAMNQWILAVRQIKRYPLRSLLMAVGTSCFAAVIVAVSLLIVGINQSIHRTVDRLGADIMVIPRGEQTAIHFNEALITGKPTQFYLSQSAVAALGRVDGVEKMATQTFAQTLTNARCCAGHFLLVGFDHTSDFTVQPWLTDPLMEWPNDETDWILVGDRILLKPGESVQFYGTPFTVAGVLAPTGTGMDYTVYLPDRVLRRLVDSSVTQAESPLQIAADHVSAVFIRVRPGQDLIDLAERLERVCPDGQAVLSSSVGKLVRTQLNVVAVISICVVAAFWLVAALLSGVVFTQAIRERRAELGLFLAKGAHRTFIYAMLAKESLLISSGASLGGAAFSLLIIGSFRQLLGAALGVTQILPSPITIVLMMVGLCAFGTVSAIMCSLLPVVGLLRTEPYEAIKRGTVT